MRTIVRMLKPIRGCFSSAEDVEAKLSAASYLCTPDIATTVYLAAEMGKPVLVEGPAGVGKTELAKASAAATGAGLIRLQCYEGLDEARAIYEWNYKKQLLRLQAASSERAWDALQDDIFSADFLLSRPLLTAIRSPGPTVLLIDEIDKADVEMEALLLEILSDFQITVPELGTIAATSQPLVVLTSNGTRDLSEALKRRCLWLHIGYPDPEREREIVSARVPELDAALAEQVVRTARALRGLDLRKPPSLAETIDWSRAIVTLGLSELDATAIARTLGVLLKNTSDHARAVEALSLGTAR
jgi:MoxR-like ATPase